MFRRMKPGLVASSIDGPIGRKQSALPKTHRHRPPTWLRAIVLIVIWGLAGVSSLHASESNDKPLHVRIDELVLEHHIGPLSPPAAPATFLRRVYLDLWGRPPSHSELQDYLTHSEGEHIEALIDRLLSSSEFAESLAVRLDVMMFMERRPDINIPTKEWRDYLKRSISSGQPLNELYRDVLAADGVWGDSRPAAKFYLDRKSEWNTVTRDVGRMVFGRDIQCAQCHDHPLISDYRQDEFHGILAFLHRSAPFVDKQNGDKTLLSEKAHGRVEFVSVFKKDAQKSVAEPVLPAFMAVDNEPLWMEGEGYLVGPASDARPVPLFSLREQLAVMATHPKSLAFNRNLANRLWALMFGAGLVQPLDLHHSENPPVHAQLLQALADGLVNVKYDMRSFLKQVVLSQTYRRSSEQVKIDHWLSTELDAQLVQRSLDECETQLQQRTSELQHVEQQLAAAQDAVDSARRDVLQFDDKWTTVGNTRNELEVVRQTADAQLATLKSELAQQQQLVAALQPLMDEAVKALEKLSGDADLVTLVQTLTKRVSTATERVKTLQAEAQTVQQRRDVANREVDAARSSIVSIRSRRVALSEFVAEARGRQRAVQLDWQHIIDHQSDWKQKGQMLWRLQGYLELRDRMTDAQQRLAAHEKALATKASVGAVTGDAQATDQGLQAEVEGLQLMAQKAQQEMVKMWNRRLAIRPARPLSPEQLSASTITALEILPAMQISAEGEWARAHKDTADAAKIAVEAKASEIHSIFVRRRQEVESTLISMFAATAGAPQDVFESSVDQALFLANDPRVQAWLAPDEGTLTKRLIDLIDCDQLGRDLYLSVLARPPDEEELAAVRDFLASRPDDRKLVVLEMVWGLLSSLEFRFTP